MDPQSLRFAKTHEWVALDGDVATVGISDFAVKLLTDIVYLEMPVVGRSVRQGETIGEIESVKAVSDLYAPVSGEVIEINEGLSGDLAQLSEQPFDAGWICRIRVSGPDCLTGLMDAAEYMKHCESEDH